MESIKNSIKLTLYSDTESANECLSNAILGSPDPATSEILIDLGRGLYKLFFQLLLLIGSNHKIAISVMSSLRQNDEMEDLSSVYMNVQVAILRYIDDADMDSLDTSISTEGEHTPTQSPGPMPSIQEFESYLNEMIDKHEWDSAVALTRQFRKYSPIVSSSPTLNFGLQSTSASCSTSSALKFGLASYSPENNAMMDDTSIIMMVYAQRLVKERGGELNVYFFLREFINFLYSIFD